MSKSYRPPWPCRIVWVQSVWQYTSSRNQSRNCIKNRTQTRRKARKSKYVRLRAWTMKSTLRIQSNLLNKGGFKRIKMAFTSQLCTQSRLPLSDRCIHEAVCLKRKKSSSNVFASLKSVDLASRPRIHGKSSPKALQSRGTTKNVLNRQIRTKSRYWAWSLDRRCLSAEGTTLVCIRSPEGQPGVMKLSWRLIQWRSSMATR